LQEFLTLGILSDSRKTRIRILVLAVMAISVMVTLTSEWWCTLAKPMGVDLCWAVSASAQELKPAFPTYHHLIFLMSWFVQYGLPFIFVAVTLVVFSKRIPWRNLGLSLLSVIATLLLAEVVLRVVGYRPGQFTYNSGIHPVDSLIATEGFVTDEFGIMKADRNFVNDRYLLHGKLRGVSTWFGDSKAHGDIFLAHGLGKTLRPDNEFWRVHDSVVEAGPSDFWSHALIDYAQNPINSEGFYSIPFDTLPSDRLRILLLGDSFTWGFSSLDRTSSFANILLARGHQVYNTGISGADVAQYCRIVDRYLEELRPDIVILNFYMGNDVAYFERPLLPHVPVLFHTNAGHIHSFQNGVQFETKEAAYANVIRNMVIPPTTTANRWLSRTVITTLMWEWLVRQGSVNHEFIAERQRPIVPIVDWQILPMMVRCHSLGIRFILSAIPTMESGELKGVSSVTGLFGEVVYHQPQMTPGMYSIWDDHFNDEGHLFYANYLEKLILTETRTE